MVREHVSMKCECANEISWVDIVQPGFRWGEEDIIVCRKCRREHKIKYDGTLANIRGGALKSEIQTIDCPICKLTKADIEKMSEEEARKVLLETKEEKPWCKEHIVKYLDLRKRRSLMGKELLRNIVD